MSRLSANLICLISVLVGASTIADASAPATQERMVEWTFESRKIYPDPFNDVDVDVIFTRGEKTWRVPAFWRGGQRWTVRFAPPAPGDYAYRLQSTDAGNPDLNGHQGQTKVMGYSGSSEPLRHGMLRASPTRRYFEYADGTPFYWLGDTWWTGLSDRLSWEGFQKLTADRRSKGFTLVQTFVGLVPIEELAPSDPGFCNEGGCVWEKDFARINPKYFDYADRRIEHLLEAGIVPALFGAWTTALEQMGVDRMKKHWRYVIARYGAYPVFWVAGGEVVDPPPGAIGKVESTRLSKTPGGWTEVVRYIRATDPYHHPLSVHEDYWPKNAYPVQDETLTDFDCLQPSHFGWASIATAVAQLNMHYARTSIRKPVVQCEIGYEGLGNYHLQDFQRAAFWLTMLNGAAGHTYGAIGTWESYSADKPFQRMKWSLTTSEEGMVLPGSYEVGIGAKLLKRYPWWQFEPHPEWAAPRGITMLEPRAEISGFGADLDYRKLSDVKGKWATDTGTIFAPYAAGIPGQVRFVYNPSFGFAPVNDRPLATILGLEVGVRYAAWFWDPTHGTKIELGTVERPAPGVSIPIQRCDQTQLSAWTHRGEASCRDGAWIAQGTVVSTLNEINENDVVVSVQITPEADAEVILRYQDENNYVSAVYSAQDHSIHLAEREGGVEGSPLGLTELSPLVHNALRLTAEVRDSVGIVSLSDGQRSVTSPIIDIQQSRPGRVGFAHRQAGVSQRFAEFDVRRSPTLPAQQAVNAKLFDVAGRYRGQLGGSSSPERQATGLAAWQDSVDKNHILLDAYRPDRPPYPGDWLIVLERKSSQTGVHEPNPREQ